MLRILRWSSHLHANLFFVLCEIFTNKCDAQSNRLFSSIRQVILLNPNFFLILVNLTLREWTSRALNWKLSIHLICPKNSLELVLVKDLTSALKSLLGHHDGGLVLLEFTTKLKKRFHKLSILR
jgi:hypothetical protein